MDRHTAKGSQLSRRDSVLSHVSQTGPAGSASPENKRTSSGYNLPPQPSTPYRQQQDSSRASYPTMGLSQQAPFTNGGNQPPAMDTYPHESTYSTSLPNDHQSQSPVVSAHSTGPIRSNSYAVASPTANQQRFPNWESGAPQTSGFVAQPNVMSFSLPPSQYPSGHDAPQPDVSQSYGAAGEYSEAGQQQQNDMMMLGDMTMPATAPVFGSETLNKSPYAGMPEDFLSYLFNSVPAGESSPIGSDAMRGSFAQ